MRNEKCTPINSLLQVLRAELSHGCQQLFTGGVELRLQPLMDLSRGEVTSFAAFALGRVQSQSPELIAPQLCEQLSASEVCRWVQENGHLNGQIHPSHMGINCSERLHADSQGAKGVKILCPGLQSQGPDFFGNLRIFSRAWLQYSVAKFFRVPASIRVGDQEFSGSIDDGAAEFIKSCISSNEVEPTFQEILKVEQELVSDSNTRLHVRLSSRVLPREVFDRIFRPHADAEQVPLAHIESQNWLYSNRLQASEINELLFAFEQKPFATLAYLAQATLPSEIDAAIPLRNEYASPLARVLSLKQRFDKLLAPRLSDSQTIYLSEVPLERHLEGIVFRRLFQHFLAGYACLHLGEPENMLKVWEDLLNRFTRFFHHPDFRRRLDSDQLEPWEREIIAGVFNTVSDMIHVYGEDTV